MNAINLLVRIVARAVVIVGLATSMAGNAQPPLPNVAPHTSVGTINCASSTCHGSVGAWDDSNVLQNEYTTWLRLDKHSKAYSVLLNDKSRLIAKNLGMKEPAHQAKACLDCHAHNPPPAQRGERFIVSEGVGCEGCHGPAEKWIKPHTVPNTPHADNIANGLYPTNKPVEQAKLCLSCHFGDENRFVTHRLMGAGHPRISFELETFATIEPAHYRIDDDWRKRKGEYNSIKIWAIGQALASQQLLDALASPKLGRDGLFPELVLFDCHACHHPMSEKKFSPRLGTGPGRIRLNDSNLLMLRAIVRVVDPASAETFNRQVALLHQSVSGDAAANGADPLAVAKKLSATIGQQINRFEKTDFNVAMLRNVLRALVDDASANNYSDYAGAEQAYMSISSLASSLAKQGGLKSAGDVNNRLSAMRKTLANEEKYRPDSFRSDLASLRNLVSSNGR